MENIFKAFIKFQSECPQLDLDSEVKVTTKTGGSYNFKYASLPNIHKIVKPILSKNGLAFIQLFDGSHIVTKIIHESGEEITSSLDISNFLSSANPQDAGSTITYFKRYTLSAILGLSSEDDDDANIPAGNKAEKKTKEPEKPWLNIYTNKNKTEVTKEFKDAHTSIHEGATNKKGEFKKYTVKDIRTKYAISKETANELENEFFFTNDLPFD